MNEQELKRQRARERYKQYVADPVKHQKMLDQYKRQHEKNKQDPNWVNKQRERYRRDVADPVKHQKMLDRYKQQYEKNKLDPVWVEKHRERSRKGAKQKV